MRNLQLSDHFTLTAPVAVISGQWAQVGDLFGVAVGASLYWDSNNGELKTDDDAGSKMFVGHAAKTASNPSAYATSRLSV